MPKYNTVDLLDELSEAKKRVKILERLVQQMLKAFDGLSRDHFAKIDVRLWSTHFEKKAARLEIKLSTKHKK